MKRTPKYVRLDVHQATTVASIRDSSGRILAHGIFATEEAAILEFFAGLRGSVHVAFEEGTQAQWLYDLLSPRVHRVVVCDRRGEKRGGNKGDEVDADRLSLDLLRGALRAVYHASRDRTALEEFARTYLNGVEDTTRTMLRLKSLFRARAIPTPGRDVYHPERRGEWLAKLAERGVRFRADSLSRQLDLLEPIRQEAKAAMLAEARKDPAWERLLAIPYLGPVRVALLLASLQTPWRFPTKRNLWGYAGFAVVTYDSAEYALQEGRVVRRRRRPMTQGLNRNCNRRVKDIFEAAANAAAARPGPLQDFVRVRVERGMREELARVTLARKLAALTLRIWKTGETCDASKLSTQRT
jgi:transposase